MGTLNKFQTVRPYITAIAVIITATALVFTIYFTDLGLHWVTFLTGILIASTLAMATRSSRSEWIISRRTSQLASTKNKLENETRLRKSAESQINLEKPRLALIDEVMPNIVALVDTHLNIQYHNRAFRDWVSLKAEDINGQHLRKVVGSLIFSEIENIVRQSLNGQSGRYNLMQKMSNSTIHPLSIQHFPQFAQNGKLTGFYMLATDVAYHAEQSEVAAPVENTPDGETEQDMFIHSFAEQVSGQKDSVNRILAAIEKDEFHLYCQLITSLATESSYATKIPKHYEILVRLLGEEDSMMPPGAFFPLAEKYGLMPRLDRWVVQHVAEWISNKNSQGAQHPGSIFFINIASDTIKDPEFPAFLQQQLLKYNISGSTLCFEIAGPATMSNIDVNLFTQQVRQCGCHVALSDFGQNGVSFELLQNLKVDFLKIDGSIILHILRDPLYLAKVSAISQVAKKIGIKTVAELVESEDLILKLNELEIDFAQGFGISRPRPLSEID